MCLTTGDPDSRVRMTLEGVFRGGVSYSSDPGTRAGVVSAVTITTDTYKALGQPETVDVTVEAVW